MPEKHLGLGNCCCDILVRPAELTVMSERHLADTMVTGPHFAL